MSITGVPVTAVPEKYMTAKEIKFKNQQTSDFQVNTTKAENNKELLFATRQTWAKY